MTKKQKKRNKSEVVQHHLRRALVPHKGNQYRPHLVRLHGLTAVIVIAMILQVTYGFVTAGHLQVLGRQSHVDVTELLAETNAARTSASLSELKVNESLNKAAALKANDMLANNYWAHDSPSGVTPWKWLGDAGYRYDIAGENLAKNYPTASATVNAWMGSPSHRDNILSNDYKDVGFAVVDGTLEGRETTLVVAYYGVPAGTTAVEGEQTAPLAYAAPVSNSVGNPLTYFGSALQSMTPASLGGLALLTLVGAVAVGAHHYRNKLPKAWRKSWKVHHGLYTFGGVMVIAVIMILATGGGQI